MSTPPHGIGFQPMTVRSASTPTMLSANVNSKISRIEQLKQWIESDRRAMDLAINVALHDKDISESTNKNIQYLMKAHQILVTQYFLKVQEEVRRRHEMYLEEERLLDEEVAQYFPFEEPECIHQPLVTLNPFLQAAHETTPLQDAHVTPLQDAHMAIPFQDAHVTMPFQDAHVAMPFQNTHVTTLLQDEHVAMPLQEKLTTMSLQDAHMTSPPKQVPAAQLKWTDVNNNDVTTGLSKNDVRVPTPEIQGISLAALQSSVSATPLASPPSTNQKSKPAETKQNQPTSTKKHGLWCRLKTWAREFSTSI